MLPALLSLLFARRLRKLIYCHGVDDSMSYHLIICGLLSDGSNLSLRLQLSGCIAARPRAVKTAAGC